MNTDDHIRILFVEADKESAGIYERRLSEKGYEVKVAYSLEQAQKHLDRLSLQLLVLDIAMEQKEGCRFLKGVREKKETKTLPVIILTHEGDRELIECARLCGSEAYFLKGQMSPSEIIKKIIAICKDRSKIIHADEHHHMV